jgi:chaperonin GroES
LVKPLLPAEITAGGVVLPIQAREKQGQLARVEAVGASAVHLPSGEKLIPLDVTPGDTVLLSSHNQIEIHWSGERYFMVHESAILGVWA